MRTRLLRHRVWRIAILAVIVPMTLAAQDSKQDVRDSTMQIYALKYARAGELAVVLNQLFSMKIVPDSRTNSLIVDAFDSDQAAIQAAITRLDVAVSSAPSALETRVFVLQYRRASSLSPILQAQISESGRFAECMNSLIVRDTPANIREITAMVGNFDVEPKSVGLEMWVLAPGAAGGLTPDLDAIEQQLGSMHLTGYGILGRAGVMTLHGESFQLDQSGKDIDISVQGKMRLVDGGGAVVEFSANVGLVEVTTDKARQRTNAQTSLRTTLRTQVGHHVIVGLSPAGSENEKPLVIVLRVVRP